MDKGDQTYRSRSAASDIETTTDLLNFGDKSQYNRDRTIIPITMTNSIVDRLVEPVDGVLMRRYSEERRTKTFTRRLEN
jgi:hypothetical protein